LWAVPLVLPIAQAWKAFDDESKARDPQLAGQITSARP